MTLREHLLKRYTPAELEAMEFVRYYGPPCEKQLHVNVQLTPETLERDADQIQRFVDKCFAMTPIVRAAELQEGNANHAY